MCASGNTQTSNYGRRLKNGIFLGATSIFLSNLAASVTFPFLQAQRDNLGCDALCYGSMQSARSGLSLVGNVLVGRLSDKVGRATALWIGISASLLSYIINYNGTSITAIWLSMIPVHLLNQNFGVFKALIADYSHELGSSESERASSLGRLGMAVGVAFMVGPTLGAKLLYDYYHATAVAVILTCISAIFLFFLPAPKARNKGAESYKLEKEEENKKTQFYGLTHLTSMFHMPIAQSRGARLLFFMRTAMAFAFSIFMTVWTATLRQRFNFGATDHAYFMGWIGLCYAASQGLLAKLIIEKASKKDGDTTNILLVCMLFLSVGRLFAMMTHSIILVYLITGMVIVALGVVNTSMASACARLAGPEEVGGLFGILEALESLAGLFGPAAGGILYRTHPRCPIIAVIVVYSTVFFAVMFYYRRDIILATAHKIPIKGEKIDEKNEDINEKTGGKVTNKIQVDHSDEELKSENPYHVKSE